MEKSTGESVKFEKMHPLVFSKMLMLMSAQVCLYTLQDLKNTNAYKKRVKETGNQFMVALDQDLQKEINRLYMSDENISKDLCNSIVQMAKVVANSKNPASLITITEILKNDINPEDYGLVHKGYISELQKLNLNVVVNAETDTHSETVCTFQDELLYNLCLPTIEKYYFGKNFKKITESINPIEKQFE